MTMCARSSDTSRGRHRLEAAFEEQVQQQRLDEVVRVMAEGDLRGAHLVREAIERAAAQARAQRARRAVGASRSSITSPMFVCSTWHSQPRASHVLLIGAVLKIFVAGVDVDADDRKADRRALAQHVENLDQRPAVLPAGEADHHAVAVFNQVEVVDRFGDFSRHLGFKVCRVPHSLSSFPGPATAGGIQPP